MSPMMNELHGQYADVDAMRLTEDIYGEPAKEFFEAIRDGFPEKES